MHQPVFEPSKPGHLLVAVLTALLFGSLLYLGIREAREDRLVGAVAPPFTLERLAGGSLSLQGLRGKVVMLDFWATWCAPCVAELPALSRLAAEYESRGVALVAANRDEGADARAQVGVFVATHAPLLISRVVYADQATAFNYHVQSLPSLYFIDRAGRIIDSYSGFASEATLRSRIERALAVKVPSGSAR